MKVLWFTNTPSNFRCERNSGFVWGGWISSLENEIRYKKNIELAVAFMCNDQPFKVEDDSVIYYPISEEKSPIRKVWKLILSNVSECSRERVWDNLESKLLKIIDDFKPDIIEVFGTEGPFGLIATRTNVPVVLHVQGIITTCLNSFLPPFLTWKGARHASLHPLKLLYNLLMKKVWEQNAEREQEIFRRVKYYMGRTVWDERVTKVLNPERKYYYCGEVLRPIFYKEHQRTTPSKFVIVTTISQAYYKGFDLVLKTAYWLKKQSTIDFEWRVYGNVDASYIEKKIGISHSDVNVRLMGVVGPEQLANTLLSCSCYVHPSYIDNSPNSLCEAQILGCLVISTNVGGIPSLIEEGVTGYTVPSNDPFQLCYLLMTLAENKDLCRQLGSNARKVALERHSVKNITNSLISVYQDILKYIR